MNVRDFIYQEFFSGLEIKSCPGKNNATWLVMNVKEKRRNGRIKSVTPKNKISFNLQSTRKESMK